MKNIIERIQRFLWGANFKQLKIYHKIIVIYFALSFCALCIVTPTWGAFIALVNFAIAALLMRLLPKDEDEL